jgi:hypothetical protein
MLSKRAKELVDLLTGKLPTVCKGEKLTMGADGGWRLEPDTVRFVKSLTSPARSDLVKSHLAGRQIKTVKNLFAVASDTVGKIQKRRAAMTELTDAELQGGTPSVGKLPGDRTTPGLGDPGTDTARFLVGLTPAEITRLMLEQYATIRENMGRRIAVGE